jgi:Domain of unknown function (DUF4190)/GYF domain 2
MYKIIGADQKEYGPVSSDQLRQWVTEGRVNGQTKVQAAGAAEWKMMSEVPEFAVLFPKSPPPPVRSAPITPLPPAPSTSQMAVWAMVLGIIGVLCCQILSPVAIVLGAVSLSQLKSHPEMTGRGFAIAGIVLGVLSLLMVLAAILLLMFTPDFIPNLQRSLQQ